MSPHPRRRIVTRPERFSGGRRRPRPWAARFGLVVGAVLLALGATACAAAFDPTGPCTADGSAPGAFPDLEAAIPKAFRGAPAGELDSGRACTPTGLGTLAGHGLKELRFAGGTWTTGTQSGVSLAVFATADGSPLDPAWVAEYYEAGALNGKNVSAVDKSDVPVTATITGRRLDVLNGDSYQSVVVWARDGRVAIALIGDFIQEIQTKAAHDLVVRAAVDAFKP